MVMPLFYSGDCNVRFGKVLNNSCDCRGRNTDNYIGPDEETSEAVAYSVFSTDSFC